MITPRRTRLVRVPDLHAFRHAIRDLMVAGGAFVVVPTESAARQLQRSADSAVCVTRDGLYDELHRRLPDPPRRLTAIERGVVAEASARAASAEIAPAFRIRPGLVAEMLRFYDQLRRQGQVVRRFEELLLDALGAGDVDSGADRMRGQTLFLAAAFREYERRVREAGALDEHMLRERLVGEAAPDPLCHVIVTVADWIADADGLYVADFDLLARLPGLASIDIVATDAILASGFDERLHDWWPGIEEDRVGQVGRVGTKPILLMPPNAPADQPWWTHRDREEELVAVAARVAGGVALDRHAVVFTRPLPYLYLAAKVFADAGIPYQTEETLPLAAEPTAAALDLVLDAVASHFMRSAIVALLRSPHFSLMDGDTAAARRAVSALDRALSEARYLGDPDVLSSLAEESREQASGPALQAALRLAQELAPLSESRAASEQLRTLHEFWSSHLRSDAPDAAEQRARAAIGDLLASLAAAYASQDDPPWTIDDLSIAIRRAIEDHTFALDSSVTGVQLVDDQAARYGEFDDVTIVGLIEADWPAPPRRNIFYPIGLLKALGWPPEKDRRAAEDARFLDLVVSASRHTIVSTFTLDDDALVTRSVLLDEIPRARLSSVAAVVEAEVEAVPDPAARDWLELRVSRTPADAAQFHGAVEGRRPPAMFSVSALETYLECPFKYFAQRVLHLEEEPDDEEIMDPRRQGQFVHKVFEDFFHEWGARTIDSESLDSARELFASVVDGALERLPSAEAGLERTRLLGSPAAAGLGDAVLRMEAERPVPVVDRLLEHPVRGDFTFETAGGPRAIAIAGKVDRVDLLADGTFRLIDYKLGWPPDRQRALQLPIYSLCVEQSLPALSGVERAGAGRRWTLGEAAYLAFKGPRRVVPLFTDSNRAKVLADAQQRLVDAVDAIGRGEFPPRPDDVYRCETCRFAAVCRKDYVGDV